MFARAKLAQSGSSTDLTAEHPRSSRNLVFLQEEAMRTVAWWLVGSLTLVVMGCSGGGSNPTAPSTNGSSLPSGTESAPISTSGSLGTPIQKGDLQTSALAIYTVDVNTETLSATSRLKEARSGQANDDLYMLSIDSFLNAGSFKITSVAADIDSVDLGYEVTHPFPAPSNPTGTPNGSTNRADLGISGMVLFLADVPSATNNTYFTDRVANTALVTNADAYFSPGGLLTTSGTANTYPYRQLVDEVADSRVGVTNGGSVDGNFGTNGWTLSELGGTNDGWTGGGVLHGGQSSKNSVSLDKGELASGFSLDVAIIAKYGDPRGGTTGAQKKANRLPPAAADATKFAYRLPHNSLDGARIVVESDAAGFIANTISAATISVHVVDPDARATETVAADLSADLGFQTVAVGESGTPTVEICIPGVNGTATTVADLSTVVDDDSTYGGDLAADTGAADDALFFQDSITKAAGAGETAGDFTGMVRVTDPETGLVIGLDGNLAPLAVPPASITYQAFSVTQLPDNAPPSATVTLLSADPLNSGTPAQVGITGISDADLDNLDITVDWGNGGGFVPVVAGLPSPYANQSPSSPNMNNTDLVVDAINVIVRLDDGTAQVDYPVNYNLGANRPPQVTGTPALAVASLTTPASFTMNAGTATATDPEGDTISRTITNNVNADVVTFAAFPNAANTTAIVPVGAVNFTAYANDALHPTASGTAYPVVVGTVTAAATVRLSANFDTATGNNAWIVGEDAVTNGAGAILTNPQPSYGGWRTAGTTGANLANYCAINGTVAVSPQTPAFASGFMGSAADPGVACPGSFLGDFNFTVGTPSSNVISPVFNSPGASTTVTVRFDSFRQSSSNFATMFYRVYSSNNGGTTWTLVHTLPALASTANVMAAGYSFTIPPATLGTANCRLRLEVGNTVLGTGACVTNGLWSIDNLSVSTTP
jgi:hypothetical protein